MNDALSCEVILFDLLLKYTQENRQVLSEQSFQKFIGTNLSSSVFSHEQMVTRQVYDIIGKVQKAK